eukprot:gene6409-10416_t
MSKFIVFAAISGGVFYFLSSFKGKANSQNIKKTVNFMRHSMDTFKQEFENKKNFDGSRQQRYEEFLKKNTSQDLKEKFEQEELELQKQQQQKENSNAEEENIEEKIEEKSKAEKEATKSENSEKK